MPAILENNKLKVEVNSKGAELTSIKEKNDNTEYLWSGNATFWNRQAPVLFPIVGKVKDNVYRFGQKRYSLGQHGFARDCNFLLIEQNAFSAKFRLSWNTETLEVYPFKFELDIEYRLVENTLIVSYSITNKDENTIWFSIGGHPGFNCPFVSDSAALSTSEFNDYYFEFEQAETAPIIPINTNNGLLKRELKPYLANTQIINLSHKVFENGALVFGQLQSKTIALKNRKNSKGLLFNFEGFPYLGLWTNAQDAPFVCIEPWFGHADYEDFEGSFDQKDGITKLPVGEVFNCSYKIQILQ